MYEKEHPLSIEKARELIAGDLGKEYRRILKSCCVPIYWGYNNKSSFEVLHNGTMTLLKTPHRLLGVTAAHVVGGYKQDLKSQELTLKLMSVSVNNLSIIDINEELDLATIDIDTKMYTELKKTSGKEIIPLNTWPPQAPQEGYGIMLAGYPGADRLDLNFGLFTALGVARIVSSDQITWRIERDHLIESGDIPVLPENYDLGGISGGPLIGWFESPNHIIHYRLSGIVSEADKDIENVMIKRADFINSDGSIRKPKLGKHIV